MFSRRRQHPDFIEGCVFVALLCVSLVIASLCTDEWITASARVLDDVKDAKPSSINYGLSKGTLIRRILDSPKFYDIYITCNVRENACMWSCENDPASRDNELNLLLKDEKIPFSCSPTSLSVMRDAAIIGRDTNRDANSTQATKGFLNAGMYYSHLVLVYYTLIELFVLLGLSVMNCLMSPTNPRLNTKGIVITANVTFVPCIIGVILYGCHYDYWIKDNIAIYDTIVGDYQSDASLGLSYWLFAAGGFLISIITMLMLARDAMLRKDRAEIVVIVAQVNDPTTVLY